jgi:membrane carboxypeptidase/penicillin-binding protein PbpC
MGQSVTFTSTVSGGYTPYNYQWYLNGSAVSGATLSTWMFTPLTIGTYKVYLNVTDSSGNVAISDTATITVAPQLTISISPMSASILVGQSVTFTSTTSGGYPPYTYQWFLNGNPVSGATSNNWTFTPTTSGIFYIHLKVTDDKGNTAQSEAARIAVAAVPVGGYSIPIQNPTKTEPILPYIALIATLTIVLTKIRNKTKRRH